MWRTQPIGLRGWRERWADRNNEQYQRAYDAAIEAWQQRDTKVRRLRAAASGSGVGGCSCRSLPGVLPR